LKEPEVQDIMEEPALIVILRAEEEETEARE
jgi:hypothetical protein